MIWEPDGLQLLDKYLCKYTFYELKEIMIINTTDPSATVRENPLTLHLVWPQWQGASVEAVRTLFSEVPLDEARRRYAVGTAVLNAVLHTYIDMV
jgi:hypothetical protein